MTLIALLPMKKNSERVPNKNFRIFNGKPLYRWVLDSLLSINACDQVIINTDAYDILNHDPIIKSDRVLIRERRKDLRGDHVSMNLIIEDDLANSDADVYLMTHTTNPLLSVGTLDDALNQYKEKVGNGPFDSLFGVTKIQTRFYTKEGLAVNHDPENLIRTQDLEPWFEENSCLYLFDKTSYKSSGARIGVNPFMFEIPKLEAFDIDDRDDWVIAEAVGSTR